MRGCDELRVVVICKESRWSMYLMYEERTGPMRTPSGLALYLGRRSKEARKQIKRFGYHIPCRDVFLDGDVGHDAKDTSFRS